MNFNLADCLRRTTVLCLCLSVYVLGGRTHVAAAADVILRAADASITGTAWTIVADPSAAGGSRIANANAGAPKVAAPLASPASHFELTFSAAAGTGYRLWMRGKAQSNSYNNDSVFVQFSDSVTAAGVDTWKIGTTSATSYVLENASGAGVSGWGWQDNGYGAGVLGPLVYFKTTGSHKIRIQVREDGLSLDQIVLSPATYLNASPGATKDDTTILTGGSQPPPSVTLVREPYLHQVTDRSAILVWASREPGPASARVGGRTFTALSTFYPAASTLIGYDYYQHEAPITGLSGATAYAYDVYVGAARATAGTDQFRTAPTPGTGSVSFVIIGDSGTGSVEQKALAALMKADTFDIMLHGGDIVYGNTGGTGDASYKTFQSWFFDIYRDTLRRKPLFPSMGNHDARPSNNWGKAYLDVYVLPEDAGTGPLADHAERYYSFDYGPVHFVALDTELAFEAGARRSAQLAWLEADLSSSTQPWKVAFFHRAPYSSGPHGSEAVATTVRQAFGPLFERHGVQVVLSAHDHNYERLVPWRVSTDLSRQAVVHFVSGAGGAPLYSVGRNEWTATSRSIHHYLRGRISGCVAQFDAIDKTGAVFDSYSFDKCAQTADTAAPTVSFLQPADGATVSGAVAVKAAANDDTRVEKVDLWVDGSLRGIDLTAPHEFTWSTAAEAVGPHAIELRAYDIDGRIATRRITVRVGGSGGGNDIVMRTSDITRVVGDWALTSDATAADGTKIRNPNRGAAKAAAAAAPASYFEVSFDAIAGVPYHLWARMRADSDSFSNDSVYFQFNGSVDASGAAIYRLGTTAATSVILEEGGGASVHGWGWNDNHYGGMAGPIYFAQSGPQTLRISAREDGVSIDQVVLSPDRYLTARPGALKDDATIVPR